MRLINKTQHDTAGLRAMLYDIAHKSHVSTRNLLVEIRRGRALHGLAYPSWRKMILWLLPNSKTLDISWIFAHELGHFKARNIKLWRSNHTHRAQKDADKLADRVTGVNKDDLTWRTQYKHTKNTFYTKWHRYGHFPIKYKTEAQEQLRKMKTEQKNYIWKLRGHRGNWFLWWKYRKPQFSNGRSAPIEH